MEVWDRLSQRGAGWYWMVGGLRNGDLYHVCALAEAFSEAHGREPIYLVTGSERQVQLASLFEESFAEILVAHGFPQDEETWTAFFKERGLPFFGQDVPLLIHPQVSLDKKRFSLEFAEQNGITWMQLYKQILHMPADVEASVPAIRPALQARASALCEQEGVTAGRSVILFPYAQSLAVEANTHFAQLAADLARDGYDVFTSISNDEVPIAGTRPIFIPFELLLDVADHAGWIVAVRSGICDITSSTECRKSVIYPNLAELYGWSLSAMGLTQDAYEVVFDFRFSSPAEFSDLIRSDINFGALAAPVRRLSGFVAADRDEVRTRTMSAATLHRGGEPPAWFVADESPGVLLISGVPPRGHARLAPAISAAFARLVSKVAADTRYYVCRDQGRYDFYEEVDADDLVAGHYGVGRCWHSAIAVRGATLPGLLPGYARPKVLEIEPTRLGERVAVSAFERSESNAAHVALSRPLSTAGIQFVEGWSYLERWGLWSKDLRATLKFTFAETPGPGAEVELVYISAASDLYPEIIFDVLVNDARVMTCVIDAQEGTRILRVPVAGAHRTVRVTLSFVALKSPHEQGRGGDRRKLGIGLIEVASRAGDDVQRSEQRATMPSPA